MSGQLIRYSCALAFAALWVCFVPELVCGVEISFVKSTRTGLHVAIQPKQEHHRIYFPIRIKGGAGATMFARIRAQTDDGTLVSQDVVFKVTADEELWQVFLRTPRFPDLTARYQVEVGRFDRGQVDEYEVLSAFAWKLDRSASSPQFSPTPTNVIVRKPVCEGGVVRIVLETRTFEPGLEFGLDSSEVAAASVNGSGAVRVME